MKKIIWILILGLSCTVGANAQHLSFQARANFQSFGTSVSIERTPIYYTQPYHPQAIRTIHRGGEIYVQQPNPFSRVVVRNQQLYIQQPSIPVYRKRSSYYRSY